MNSNWELFRLNDNFSLYLKYALNVLYRKCDEIRNSLNNSYIINFRYYYIKKSNSRHYKKMLENIIQIKKWKKIFGNKRTILLKISFMGLFSQ